MSQGVEIAVREFEDRPGYHCEVRIIDPDQHGRKATFSLVRKVEVKDSRPVHEEEVLFEHDFECGRKEVEEFEIPAFPPDHYSYEGVHIRVHLLVRVVIDDGYIWDTTADRALQVELFRKPKLADCARSLVDPDDQWDFFANVQALPAGTRELATGVAVVAGVGLLLLTGVAIHDARHGPMEAWIFPGGEPGVVLVLWIVAFLVGALVAYLFLQRTLRSYVELDLLEPTQPIRRGETRRVSELLRGRTRVPLEGFELRVVACNQERGQYVRGSGTSRRKVSFSEPVRGVLLYSRRVGEVGAGVDLGGLLDEAVDFTPMFDGLFPTQRVGTSHGVEVYWEVQLLHDQFLDLERPGDASLFLAEDFACAGDS